MTPVSLEDYILDYLERSSGCTTTLTVPPPTNCPSTVTDSYSFLAGHYLTGAIVLFFLVLMFMMTMTAFFPPEGHH